MSDISVIARHAVTVLAGQLAVMAFGVTDTIVAGRFSADALAALSVASAVFVSVYVSLMGVARRRPSGNRFASRCTWPQPPVCWAWACCCSPSHCCA